MKVSLPAQTIPVDTPHGVDPIWYEKFKLIQAMLNSGSVGQGALATTATTGFGYMPTCAGAPTGVPFVPPTGQPNPQAGYAPFVYDTTNNKLWIYNPVTHAWKGVVLT